MSDAKRYDSYGRMMEDAEPDMLWYWVRRPDHETLRAENAALRELLEECATPGVCHFDLGVKIDKTLAALERKP
jgi:hypothetical protein